MSRYCKQGVALVALAAAIVLCGAPESVAKKPGSGGGPGGGGGGPGQNGGGLIYFRGPTPTDRYATELYTMNDDGSGLAVVTGFPAEFRPSGEPSRQLHAGKRWFSEWHFALSDAGDVVSLEIDPQLERLGIGTEYSQPRWRVGDGSLSWIGRRLDGSGAAVEGGIYTTELDFDALGNVTGAGATELLVSLPLVVQGDGSLGPDIWSHNWSPDGTQFVYDTSDGQLVIADLLTGTFDEIVTSGPMHLPQWSPAGDKLMVKYQTRFRSAVGVMNTDGTGLKLVEAGGFSWHTDVGVWSPTGSHLVYVHTDNLWEDSYIARATSNGTGKRRLTDASLGWGSPFEWLTPFGWRDLPASGSASVPEPGSLLLGVLAVVGLLTWRTSSGMNQRTTIRCWPDVRRLLVLLFVACCQCLSTVSLAAEVTFDWSIVGNPGNAPDQLYPANGNNPNNLRFGSVANKYRISTYEVTNDQYTEFLNAVDPMGMNPNSVYNSFMTSDNRGGIDVNFGAASGSKYSSKTNFGNKPVNFVSYFDSMRFVNWLANGQPTGGSGTESGVYTIGNGVDETRAPGAKIFIPSEDEWYKAAYYDPRSATQGGPAGDDNYWLYPTSSDSVPTVAMANATGDISNPGSNVANYDFGAHWNGKDGNVTTVGTAGAGSVSFYGTFDQGGNLWEWTEAVLFSSARGLRGGGWGIEPTGLAASNRLPYDPSFSNSESIGFRVASVPEPGSLLLGGLALAGLLIGRRSLLSSLDRGLEP